MAKGILAKDILAKEILNETVSSVFADTDVKVGAQYNENDDDNLDDDD